MLEQDTDRPQSPEHLEYWRRRLPNSPGMQAMRARQRDKLRHMEVRLRRKAEQLRQMEQALRHRDEVLRQREAESASDEPVGKPQLRVAEIARLCAEASGIPLNDLLSPRRARCVVRPRQVAAWIAKKHTSRTLPEIGKRLGGKDHSTILHAVRKVDDLLKAGDQPTIRLVRDVEARL